MGWLNGERKKTRLHAAYNGHTSGLNRLKVNGWKRQTTKMKMKASCGSDTYIDTTGFKTKTAAKERHHAKIKGSVQQKNVTIVNIYAPARKRLNT